MKIWLYILFFLFSSTAVAQEQDSVESKKTYVQLSGFTIDDETFIPIPYIYIYNKNLKTGGLSDAYGFFSIVAGTGDTILFKSITYKQAEFIVPDSLADVHMTHFQSLISQLVQGNL